MNAFRQFVEQNSRWFSGHSPESNESLGAAEESLGLRLPSDVKWLLCNYGYWHATGISSLEETVENTIAAREHLALPMNYVVLYDHQDGGVILLDTIETPKADHHCVFNIGWESIPNEINSEIVYDTYQAYVSDLMVQQQSFIAPEDIEYDPAMYDKA